MSAKNPLLGAALFYARKLGWGVFPLKPRAKEPLTPHGHKDATTDPAKIHQYWTKWPNANIGTPTGMSFWVLDIDPRNGGEESLAALVGKHGPLAETLQQTTGGGGSQRFYQMPDQQVIGCHTGIWPGIDVKGEGGYVVLPPSIHPSGKPYVWDGLKPMMEQPISSANAWSISGILATNQKAGEPFQLPGKIPKGKQHNTLFKMGAAMRHKGCEYPEILEALWQLNAGRCEEPGPRANIEKLAESICKQYAPGGSAPGQREPPKGPKPIARDPADSLYNANYPDPAPIVDPILYPGLTILGGRPKAGKSYFALQLAVAVISGQKLGSYLDVKKTCRCLYVSLEDKRRQIRSRLRRLTAEEPCLARLNFVFELDPLLAGGAAALDQELTAHPADVLILDSLLAVVKQAKRANVDVMQADYNIVAILRELAEKHSLALVLVAHTRKAGGDFLDLIQGTSGTTAAADAVWVLARSPDGTATLSVTGRDVPTNVFGLKRADSDPAWSIVGEGDEVTQSEARREVLRLLREEGPMSPSRIAGKLRKAVSGVHRLLDALCAAAQVVRTHHGTYQIPRPGMTPHPNGKEATEDSRE